MTAKVDRLPSTEPHSPPPLYLPFAPAIHPDHEAIDQQSNDWARAYNIGGEQWRQRLVTQGMGTFGARVLPDGQREMVQICADLVFWLFGADDELCEEGEPGKHPERLSGTLFRLLRVAQNPEAPVMSGDPLAEGLRNLSRRIRGLATPGQAARWVDGLREYFLSVIWEASHRSRETVPSLDDYALMRLSSIGLPPYFALLEAGHGYELHPLERDRVAVRAAVEMAEFLAAWDNDILSHHKESTSGHYYLNVIRVLRHSSGLSTQDALDEAVRQRDRVMCRYLRLRHELSRQGSPQLRRYLDSLDCYIRGMADWELSSTRYPNPGAPTDPAARVTDSPTDDSPHPLPIPSISWWWDRLL